MIRGAARLPVAALVLVVAGCGSSVRRQDLEGQIAAFVQKQTGADITVHCPDGVKADPGVRVSCTTELSGAPTVIDIEFVDKGKFRITRMHVRTAS